MGRIHSFQSLGTVDGPGVRFVVFFQGCPLRCKCCHNPDTWDFSGGEEYSPIDVAARCKRYRDYFGEDGGITISGGEPLLQPEFARDIFKACKTAGINTCLDTSGCLINDKVKELLKYTDRVLLDVKYAREQEYKENVGCSLSITLEFLEYLNKMGIPTWLRQVIIPTKNDTSESVLFLKALKDKYSNIEKIELLPFRKICESKYDNMNLEFPFKDIPEPSSEQMSQLNSIIK